MRDALAYLNELREQCEQEILADLEELVRDELAPDGLAYGDAEFKDDADFVLYMQDLSARGVLVHLQVIAPEVYGDLLRRYERAIGRSLIGKVA